MQADQSDACLKTIVAMRGCIWDFCLMLFFLQKASTPNECQHNQFKCSVEVMYVQCNALYYLFSFKFIFPNLSGLFK